jgi:hypothetical protein
MKKLGSTEIISIAVVCLGLLFSAAASAQQALTGVGDAKTPTYIIFNVTGAGTKAGQGTGGTGINAGWRRRGILYGFEKRESRICARCERHDHQVRS